MIDEILQQQFRVVYVEGTRLSGKTTWAKRLTADLTFRQDGYGEPWHYYCTFKDRKSDSTRFLDAALDIGQAALFVLDLLRQTPHLRLVCDRSTISSYVYARLSEMYGDQKWILPTALELIEARLRLFKALLEEVNGVVVRVCTPLPELHTRARGNQRASEIPSLEPELQFFDEAFELAALPSNRVILL